MEARFDELSERVRRTEEGQIEILRKLDALLSSRPAGPTQHEGTGSSAGNGGNGGNGGNNVTAQERKLELPVFSGEDVFGWLNKVERYFRVNGLTDTEKLSAVLLVMEGEALNWFQWWEINNSNATWVNFRTDVLSRFQPELDDNPYRSLFTLKQVGSVADFRVTFEQVVSRLKFEDEEVLRGAWLNGLTDSIREELLMHPMNKLSEMMKMATKIERRNIAWATEGMGRMGLGQGVGANKWAQTGRSGAGFNSTRPINTGSGNLNAGTKSNVLETSSIAPKTNPSSQNSSTGSSRLLESQDSSGSRNNGRRLPQGQLQERSRLGLCFKCEERWNPNHRCKVRQLQVLIIDDDEVEEDKQMVARESTTAADQQEVGEALQISMHSLLGLSSSRTLKLWGQIEKEPVVTLIDCGASHNFVSKDVASRLRLLVDDTPRFWVEVGNGHRVACHGVCRKVPMELQGHNICQDFHLFDLGGTDVVLGLEWLTGLGEIKANFKEMTLKFENGGNEVLLRGDPSLSRAVASLKTIVKAINDGGTGFLIEQREPQAEEPTESRQELDELLEEFQELFREPKGLPPRRAQDHAIVLKPGSQIANSRPYRYPPYQKTEIEKLVSELLDNGWIRHSVSPYASPVILVKKKNGSWRVCVDYRALNKHIVPDKFPMPVIEELLDELGGSKIFTKLDLKSGFNQISMREEDIPKTAFKTHEGHYDQSDQEHISHLRKVMEALRQHQLVLNKKKCCFGQRQVEYLGHIISGAGVMADPKKIEAMEKWPRPSNIKGLRGVLGLTGYYRKFVQNYGKIASL
ncbi:uncharacterized protein LOC133304100 [Gastrolobium bilobum]|uniref:uncharacterized protein LOC133304100 n=1 Tax=Gastrolobium bilobum TaxID=150636 RepID=UPI002AB10F74|nr:uncharacterized protein LOC133304100 [Gastrolobium bilobum]